MAWRGGRVDTAALQVDTGYEHMGEGTRVRSEISSQGPCSIYGSCRDLAYRGERAGKARNNRG